MRSRHPSTRYLCLLSLLEDPYPANTFVDAQGPPSAVVPPLHGFPTLSPRTLVRHRRAEMPHVRGPRPDTCNELSPRHAFRPNGGLHFCQAVRQTRPCGDGNMESTTNKDLLQILTVRLLYAKQHIVHHLQSHISHCQHTSCQAIHNSTSWLYARAPKPRFTRQSTTSYHVIASSSPKSRWYHRQPHIIAVLQRSIITKIRRQ